jgi:hypothetical protein
MPLSFGDQDSLCVGTASFTDAIDPTDTFRRAIAAIFGAVIVVGEALTSTIALGAQHFSGTQRSRGSVSLQVGRQLEIQSQIMGHASLNKLGELRRDWNGYGAPPIDPEIIAKASEFINNFGAEFQGAPQVVPMTKGRLQFEWHRGNRSLEIEFEDSQTLHYLKWDSDQGLEDEDVISVVDTHTITDLLLWFSSEERNADPAECRTTSS